MRRNSRLKRIRPLHTRGRGVTAALPPFKREGKGSTPFGPILSEHSGFSGGA
jgi:hypothetical protein